MEYGIGDTLPGRARFEDSSGVGMDGLTVHVDVIAPDGTLADTALVATGRGHSSGLYDLDWTGENGAGVEALGGYTLIFKVISGGSPAKAEQCSHFLIVAWQAAGKVAAIADGLITAAKIGAGALTNAKFGAGALAATNLNVDIDARLKAAIVAALMAQDIDGETFLQTLRLMRAHDAGKTTAGATGVTNFLRADDTTIAFSTTVNSTTNLRTATVIGDLT